MLFRLKKTRKTEDFEVMQTFFEVKDQTPQRLKTGRWTDRLMDSVTTAVKDKTTNTLNLETTTRHLKRFEMKYEDILVTL